MLSSVLFDFKTSFSKHRLSLLFSTGWERVHVVRRYAHCFFDTIRCLLMFAQAITISALFSLHKDVVPEIWDNELTDGLDNLMDENGILWDDMDTLPDVSDAELDRVS